MANNATIVAASLNDQELLNGINKLVQQVENGTKQMAQSMDTAVDHMKKKLAELGNVNVDFGGSADGGSSRRAKKQQEETAAVKETTAAYKEQKATFDQMAHAKMSASTARQSAATFIERDREQLRMRQHAIEAEMQRYKGVEIPLRVKDEGVFQRALDSAKQKIEDMRRQLAQVPPMSPLGRQFSQELQNAKRELDQLLLSRQAFVKMPQLQNEYAQNNQKIEALAYAYKSVYENEKQAEQAIKQGAQAVDRYGESADKAYTKMIRTFYARTTRIPTDDVDLMRAKLERLQSILANTSMRGVLSPQQIASSETEVRRLVQAIAEVEQREMRATNSAEQYSAEISRQAKLIRESAEYKAGQSVTVQTPSGYDAVFNIKDKESIEERLTRVYQMHLDQKNELNRVEQQETATAKEQLAIEERLNQVETQVLNTEREITEEQKKRKYVAPTVSGDERFKSMVAKAAGINKSEITVSTTVIQRLTTYVKQLQSAYVNLTSEERKSPFGRQLREELQATERAVQKLRSEMSRPISFGDAMRLPAKTLDDIAYKIRQLQSYKMGIDITKPNAQNEIKQVDAAINQLEKDMRKYMGTGKSIIEQNNALSRSWNYMKNRLAFYFTVGAATSFVKNLIEVRSQYEMNERALGILIGSAERGTQIFQELSQMSLVSPYTLIELSTAAKQLTAYDVAARDVVDTTRRLADMASAVGIPIERLTYALGQIKAYGYLNSRDARMFSNAGIPLVKQLSEYYTELEGHLVSTADVYDRMKKKTIEYNDVMQVMYKMTDEGGKFFDFQAKMADTLKVRLANLTLAWNNMLNEIGRSEQGLLTGAIGALRTLFLHWKEFSEFINHIAWTAGIIALARAIQYLLIPKMTMVQAFGTRIGTTLQNVGAAWTKLISSSASLYAVLAMAVMELGFAIYNAGKAQRELNQSIKEGAEDNFKNISEFIEQYEALRQSLYQKADPSKSMLNGVDIRGVNNINSDDARKAWEAMREQIELTSSSSDKFVGSLLTIENVSERLRRGFELLEEIRSVDAAIKEMDDDTIKLKEDWSAWWNLNLLPDGIIEELNNFSNIKTALDDLGENLDEVGNKKLAIKIDDSAIDDAIDDAKERLDKLKQKIEEDFEKTSESLRKFISNQGWSGSPNKIEEFYSGFAKKTALKYELDPQAAFEMQVQVEEAKTEAMRRALEIRLADERAAYKATADENTKTEIEESIKRLEAQQSLYKNTNAYQRAEWERFTKWMSEQHRYEVQHMFQNMTADQIKELNFTEGVYGNWVDSIVKKYADEHNIAYDNAFKYLKSWVNQANTWSIFIDLIISTSGAKSYFDILSDWDTKADASYNKQKRLREEINRLEKEGKKNTEEYANATKEEAQAQKEYNEAVSHGGKSKASEADAKRGAAAARRGAAAATRAQRQAETELQKALKEELSLLDKIRSTYKSLTKEGVDSQTAIAESTKGYEATVGEINKTLAKYGVTALDIKKFAGITNPNELMKMLQSQLDTLQKSGKLKKGEIKDLQVKLNDVNIEAITFNQKKITDSLNNELSKLSDEYELAVSLDADPELGSTFAEMFGINIETLPRTVEEYAAEATKYINKFLKEKNSGVELPNLLNVTNDDLRAFEEMVKSEKLNEEVYKTIEKAIDDVRAKRKKDMEETSKGWNSLIEKYGGLQSKLVKIYKESVVEQVNVAKKFGTAEEKAAVIDIADMIRISEDPVEIARLQVELAKLMQTIKERNPKAFEMEVSIANMEKNKVAKAFWDDFKNSDLYTTTFEDMSNNSVRAIELIIDKMEELKDKVKEDPASMKALMKQLTDAEKELANKDPFKGFILGIKYIRDGAREVVAEREKLANANAEVTSAQEGIGEAEKSGDFRKIIAARDRLSAAIAKQKQAEVDLAQAESKGKKGQNMLTASLSALSAQLDTVSNAFSGVASLFKAAGLDEEAEAIEAINEGFSVMATVIELVSAAMAIAQAENPWLLAAAAALSIIVGLVSFLAGNSNKKITEQVEASERAVKRLEIAYVDLQHAIDNAYGANAVGAKRALAAAKELELAELKRQLRLEKSRKEKDRDEDKILDLQKEIRELMYEITDSIREITDDLLGSDVGGFAENLVSSMIDAFKQGEDYMKVFEDSFDKMIDNLIMKSIVSRVVASYLDKLWSDLDNRIESRSRKEADAYAKAVEANALTAGLTDDEIRKIVANEKYHYMYGLNYSALDKVTQEDIDAYRKTMQDTVNTAKAELDAVTAITDEDILSVIEQINQIKPELGEQLKAIFGQWYKFGQDSDKTLSNLQQGIQGITEDTAGALEAMLNRMSQQMYYNSDLLTEIRDTVVSFDMDVQLGTLSQMLLQLQQSYAVQLAIQGILNGVLNPSGNAFTVELR